MVQYYEVECWELHKSIKIELSIHVKIALKQNGGKKADSRSYLAMSMTSVCTLAIIN